MRGFRFGPAIWSGAIGLTAFLSAGFCAAAAPPPAILSLSGTDWRIHDDASGKGVDERLFEAAPAAPGWVPATVPGNIQADLETAHLLKPLSYGAGDKALDGVANKDWWYRKDFTVPASFAGQRLTLVFDGVEKESEIWLNGQKVGSNVGMFKRFWFDVTAIAKPGAINQLAVRLLRRTQEDAHIPWRSATNGAWDWSTHIKTLGIWKDVRLEATGPARIDWTRVRTELTDDHASAKVLVSLDVNSTADVAAKARFRVTGQGREIEVTVDAAIKKGPNTITAELPLEKPALWWPSGHGSQPLYTLEAELQGPDGAALDRRSARFGVRDIRWEQTEAAPADYASRFHGYQLVVNGRHVRTMGSCLVPPELYFGHLVPRGLYLLRQAKASGMNTLRIWGGGVILHDAVYDLADELGLMLVLEFPMANHMPPKDDAYLAMVDETARNIVRQVRNHPSIIEFDGGNEMYWKSDIDHPAFDLLKRIVAEEDGRVFRAACPDLGGGHGPWEMDRKWYQSINEINTKAVVGGKEQVLRPTMRQGEFGNYAPAHLEVWQREIPIKDQWPIQGVANDVLCRKRAVRAAGQYGWLNKGVLEDLFGPFDSLELMVESGRFFGADGLRYMVDGFRRSGRRIGGLTTWDFNEPWPNVAGSFMVDYDGRTNMLYDFFKQAIAPVTLSLKYNTPFYPLDTGMKAELFLTSDAPQPVENLRWKWLARDRRGTVFARDEGTASISPIEFKSLGEIRLMPPAQTIFGPIYMELRLEDAGGKLLTERLHVFGLANLPAPFAQLVKNSGPDPDDDASLITTDTERPTDVNSMARYAVAKSLTPPPPPRPQEGWRELPVTDGYYGDDRSFSDGWFTLKLVGPIKIGRFKFGRDRNGICTDRCADFMKIELSPDGEEWHTVFERDKLTQLPGFSPFKTVEIEVAPVIAQYVRVTLMPPGSDEKGPFPVIDEFQVYPPKAEAPADLPTVKVLDRPEVWRPTKRTTLAVEARPMRIEGGQEVLEIVVTNTGPMTAFPCEIHPLISYRTDLFTDNNHCFVPPGESRTITIRADRNSACGLTLAQTGWWLSCWNAEQVVLPPDGDVLLAVGRRDKMCREFAGYFDPAALSSASTTTLAGARPDPSGLPYRLDGGRTARFEFPAGDAAAKQAARLRLHTADQSKDMRGEVTATLNGRTFTQTLPAGLGIQQADPAHLAFPATAEFAIPAGVLQAGANVLEVRVKNAGWFTWDALECVGTD